MARLEKSIEIEAPPGKVFALLSDTKEMNELSKGFTEVEQTSKGPPGVGATYHYVGRGGGQTAEWDVETTEFVKDRKMAFRSIGSGKFKNDGAWTLERTATGTKLTFSMNYTLPYSIVGRIVDKLRVSKDIEKGMGRILDKVKKALEK